MLAQFIASIVGDATVRRQLTERGWRRYQECFTNQGMERYFLRALQPLLASQPAPKYTSAR